MAGERRRCPLHERCGAQAPAGRKMKLNQVTVGVTDYDAAVDFYTRLGLKQIVDAPPRYARFETPTGETFSIHLADRAGSSTIVYFEVEDVDAFVAALDLPLTAAPTDQH